ncbi:cytochrome b [Pseudomonas sp. TTU2014-080ASC]|uniref:cytochrome b n=1 Tax=Pseudomonas sp. TTU2014-080ASC TaxID=1729724 RepID=UPI0007189952|nr:cytochrome b [Pseudomonas sp. TTU2014-080ASC]KRW58070.1 cytochrome B [Pseudomonas sp. TTU2014-080ASC]
MTRETTNTPQTYDSVSRILHWGMAAGFAWVFSSALAHKFFNEGALDSFLWPTHKAAGLLLAACVVIRLLWAVLNRSRRPASVSLVASLGHLALYALMVAVPFIGLLRQFGSGRAFEAFGVQIMAATPDQTYGWMVDLGGNFHSLLGWVLLALIVGHIVMTLLHRRDPSQDVLPRMLG